MTRPVSAMLPEGGGGRPAHGQASLLGVCLRVRREAPRGQGFQLSRTWVRSEAGPVLNYKMQLHRPMLLSPRPRTRAKVTSSMHNAQVNSGWNRRIVSSRWR